MGVLRSPARPEAGEALVTLSASHLSLRRPSVLSLARGCPRLGARRVLKIFQNLDQLQASGLASTCARRIALTTCLNRRRWWRAGPNCVGPICPGGRSSRRDRRPIASPDPGQLSAARDLVEKMLERLEPRDRLLIELLELEQCGLPEIQRLTGWSAVNVRVRVFRARRKLRSVLRGLLDE